MYGKKNLDFVIFCVVFVMFFEIFFCGSFEVESIEEFVLLLYVENSDEDLSRFFIKKLMDFEFLRFVEIVNIEDKIMNEDEIV